MREASARIIDSLPEIGGQLTTLYPEKWIFDVPGHPQDPRQGPRRAATAGSRSSSSTCPSTWRRPRTTISWERRHVVVLHTDRGDLRSRTVIVAGGHGAFEPKKLPGLRHDAVGGPRRALPRRLQEGVRRQARRHRRRRRLRLRLGRQPARHRRAGHARAPPRGLPRPRGDGRGGHGRPRRAGASTCTCPTRSRDVRRQRLDRGASSCSTPRTTSASSRSTCDAILLQLGFKTALGPLQGVGLRDREGRDRASTG